MAAYLQTEQGEATSYRNMDYSMITHELQDSRSGSPKKIANVENNEAHNWAKISGCNIKHKIHAS